MDEEAGYLRPRSLVMQEVSGCGGRMEGRKREVVEDGRFQRVAGRVWSDDWERKMSVSRPPTCSLP